MGVDQSDTIDQRRDGALPVPIMNARLSSLQAKPRLHISQVKGKN